LEGESIIPAYVFEKDDRADVVNDIKDNIAYVLAANGWFLRKSNELYASVTAVKSADFLGQLTEGGMFKTVKIPKEILMQVNGFMKAVYDKHKSESVVLLYHSFSQKRWIWAVPEQEVASASVNYKMTDKARFVFGKGVMEALPEGYVMIGSVHSHASMSAFASGTDNHDECAFDGFHITVGNMDKDFSYHARLIMSGMKRDVPLNQVVEDMANTATFPELLLANVSERSHAVDFGDSPQYQAWADKWGGNKPGMASKGRPARLSAELYDPFHEEQDACPGARSGGGSEDIPLASSLGIKIHGSDDGFNKEEIACLG
jgi:proteasome lid subunit RPN8/RPN11